MVDNYLVTIFIPVYNGESYLVETLTSIQKQQYANIEVLLVDDASTDNSLYILNEFAQKDTRFKVFKKENGGVVAKSMNFIRPYIKGDFFFYSSQDDIFSSDLIQRMMERQIQTQADTVLPDMEFYYKDKTKSKKIIGLNGNRTVVLSGKQSLVESLNWNIHGFALLRTTLLKGEFFPEDAFDSDEFMTRKLFLKSNKVVFCEGTFFYRQDNLNAITKTFSVKNFYTLNTLKRLYDLLQENKIDQKHVFNVKHSILRRYLYFLTMRNSFEFTSEKDKKEVTFFLSDFRNNVLTNAFCFDNFGYALKKGKLKFMIRLFVFHYKK